MQVIQILSDVLRFFGPLIALASGVLVAYSLFKWAKRLGVASKVMLSSPITAFFMLLVVVLFIWFYFKYLAPYLKF